jgi:hypothetical protein
MATSENHTQLAGFVQVDRIEIGWMSMEQARLFCKCGNEMIRQAVRSGRLKAFVKRQKVETAVYRKGWHFDREELARWIADGKPTRPVVVAAPVLEPLPLLKDAKPLIDSDIRLLYKMLSDLTGKVDAMAADVAVLRKALG